MSGPARGRVLLSIRKDVAHLMRCQQLHDLLAAPQVDTDRVRRLLRAEVRDWMDRGEVPAGVVHPLTFLYFPLHRAEKTTLRLHIWPSWREYAVPTTSEYHKHAWSLTSYIIAGTVRNEMPRITLVDRSVADYRLFDIEGRTGEDRIQPRDEWVRFEDDVIDHHRRHSVYRIVVDRYHASTSAPHEFAATLCLVDRSVLGREVTLGPVDGIAHVTHRRPVPAEDARLAIKELALHLGA